MRKILFSLSTVAILSCSCANAFENRILQFNQNVNHVEITDDMDNQNKQFLKTKHFFPEKSLTKGCLDKIVAINSRIDKWIEDHPYLIKVAEYATNVVALLSVFVISPILIAGWWLLSQIIVKGEEYLIDLLVEKGYSEEEVITSRQSRELVGCEQSQRLPITFT